MACCITIMSCRAALGLSCAVLLCVIIASRLPDEERYLSNNLPG